MYKRHAIALVIVMFFIMAITVSVGVGLKQATEANKEVEEHNFILQTNIVLDDVLKILQNSYELKQIVEEQSVDSLFLFLSQASIIPFETNGLTVVIELSSARSKFNINSLVDLNDTKIDNRVNALENYLSNYNLNDAYIDILLDNMSKIKDDMSYNSSIFNEKPYLFRDYIVSYKHLSEINDFYLKMYNENFISKVDFENLFDFSKNRMTKIDLNYANIDTWRLLLNCDEERARQLSLGAGSYRVLVDLNLEDEEKAALDSFDVSYFEPFIDVKIEIIKGVQKAKVSFEYDMTTRKGSNFVYKI